MLETCQEALPKTFNSTVIETDDAFYMRLALELAQQAAALGEVPIGALLVRTEPSTDTIVGRGFNLRESLADPTAHAEIIALRQAATTLGDWRLENCTLYVTAQPCLMCFGSLVWARVPRLVYGCRNPKLPTQLDELYESWPGRPTLRGGLYEAACSATLTSFFRELRNRNKGEAG